MCRLIIGIQNWLPHMAASRERNIARRRGGRMPPRMGAAQRAPQPGRLRYGAATNLIDRSTVCAGWSPGSKASGIIARGEAAIQKVTPQGYTAWKWCGFGRLVGRPPRVRSRPSGRLIFSENSAVLGALCWCDVLPAAAVEGPSHRAFPTFTAFFFAHPCS